VIRRLAGWAILGALAAGAVVVVRRTQRLARVATPEGAADLAGSVIGAARDFALDVRTAAARRESELRAALLSGQVDDDGPTVAPPPSTRRGRPGGWQEGDEDSPLYDF
jgi:hypothetical protein